MVRSSRKRLKLCIYPSVRVSVYCRLFAADGNPSITRLAAIDIQEINMNFITILKKLIPLIHLYIALLTLWWLKRRISLKQVKRSYLPDFS